MNQQPLVSVIMIFLDAALFIVEAIESVFAQTYPCWELLLVDDGSTDGSTELALRAVAQSAGQVRYFEHPTHVNCGMSASRNLGLRHARGEYLAFLDADDVWLPSKLARQLPLLAAQPHAGMLYGATQYWYSWTGRPEDRQRDYIYEPHVPTPALYQPPILLTRFLNHRAAVPCMGSVLARRRVVEQVRGWEDSFRGLYEDHVFHAKMCLAAPMFVSGEWHDRYRQHPHSSCAVADRTGQVRSVQRSYLNWLAEYLSQRGLHGSEVWQAMQQELWACRHPFAYRLLKRMRRRLEWIKEGVLG